MKLTKALVKARQSLYRPGQNLEVPGRWGSQLSRQPEHEGGKVVSPTHRPPFPQGNIPVLISVRGWVDPRAKMHWESKRRQSNKYCCVVSNNSWRSSAQNFFKDSRQLVDAWLYTSGNCRVAGFGKGGSESGERELQPPPLTHCHAILWLDWWQNL